MVLDALAAPFNFVLVGLLQRTHARAQTRRKFVCHTHHYYHHHHHRHHHPPPQGNQVLINGRMANKSHKQMMKILVSSSLSLSHSRRCVTGFFSRIFFSSFIREERGKNKNDVRYKRGEKTVGRARAHTTTLKAISLGVSPSSFYFRK